jgi:exonuclease III
MQKTSKKIFSVTRERDEIVLLSDIRLNSSKQVAATMDIGKRFGFRGYNFIHNSTSNSRGAGILISNKLQATIHNTYKDLDCNLLIIDVTIAGKRFTLGSVYGPNTKVENFFSDILHTCNTFANPNIILGGDWNTTVHGRPTNSNIDTINRRRTKWLDNLCTRLGLSDPYRHFYPECREFTYIPNAVANQNRSRLDFFLVTDDILLSSRNCMISHHLDNLLFDHKSVCLSFHTNKNNNRQVIKDTILKDKDLSYVVRCQVTEHYIHHALICDDFPLEFKLELLGTIGLINHNLTIVRNLLTDIATGDDRGNTIEKLDNTRLEIERLLGLLPHIDYLESLALTCDNKSFFETLVMSVKNVTLSTQQFFYKIKNKTKDTIKKQLKTLKQNYIGNQGDIFRLEARLSRIVDSELGEEINLNRNFEKLNDEKITPYFMSLAKQSGTDALLSDIRNDNGTDFIDSNERENYITDYYKDLYRVRENNNIGNDSILEFLGEVAVHPDVLCLKLTENEKSDLERPLSLVELDSSAKKGKLNTAPGIDGMTNKFILHFWEYYRTPLYKYTLACYDSGSLTDNFRSA